MGGLLHLVQRGAAWASCGTPSHLLTAPNVTAHASKAIVYQLHIIRRGTIITKHSMYRAFNAVFGKVWRIASPDVVELVKTKCLPMLCYGIDVCPVNKSQIESLQYVVDKCFRKISDVKSTETVQEYTREFNWLAMCDLIGIRKSFFCWVLSDLDKISQTGAEWHLDCGDMAAIETRSKISIRRTFGRIQWHVIPEPRVTLQGVRIPSAILKIVFRHILFYFFLFS